MSQPLISVIICCWNGERFLRNALRSIDQQDYENYEIIFVDDGSTDGSVEIARQHGGDIHIVQIEHSGLPAARNAGIRAARGVWITFLDCDDIYLPGRLTTQAQLLQDMPEQDVVIGQFTKSLFRGVKDGEDQFELVEPAAPCMSLACSLIRREVFERVGGFDEEQSWCDDWDWFLRVRELGVPIHMHKGVMADYRRHDHNMTNDEKTGNKFTLMMLRNSLQRRREQHGKAESLPSLVDGDK